MQEAQTTRGDSAAPEELATCQCIIAHPSKPKFLAVKHTTGYLPPVVKVPLEAAIGVNVKRLLEGVRNKYGLNTIALRYLDRWADYHCVELDLRGAATRRLDAIWVGLDDYRRMRGDALGEYDPFVNWLQARQSGAVSELRRPWERRGWFVEAERWIQFQLDRLNIQPTGSVVQYKALSHNSAVLRVPTSGGDVYFKAADRRAPPETGFTQALSERWPRHVTELLASDADRNWMLMPDFSAGVRVRPSPEELAQAAALMARIQIEAADSLDQWAQLGCQPMGLEELAVFLERGDVLRDELAGGRFPFSAEELQSLSAALLSLRPLCDSLAAYGLPATLLHPDFRAANLVFGSGEPRIIDWADTRIGHPYFALLELLRSDHDVAIAGFAGDPVVQAYLEPFRAFGGGERLVDALRLARELRDAWRLMHWEGEFTRCEAGGVAWQNTQRWVQSIARGQIAAARE